LSARPATRRICALALEFPCMRSKAAMFDPETFDAEKLEQASRAWSTGERHCVAFILAIWSGRKWEECPFDLIEVATGIDRTNLQPIIDWLHNPWTP